jgi:putative PEP-CTERM system histidine kinase
MALFPLLPFAAALLSLLLAIASVVRKAPSRAAWCFFAGMLVLAVDSLCTGLGLRAVTLPGVLGWLSAGLVAKSLLPLPWLGFSLTYSRGDSRETLSRWKLPLAGLALVPVVLAVGFRDQLLQLVPMGPAGEAQLLLRSGTAARGLNAVLLVVFVLVLMHLEQTFRAAVGTMRWRIKYVVLGLGAIFGAQIYVRSQAILYSAYDLALTGIESSGVLIGGVFLTVAYARTGFAEIEAYPSRAVLRSSLTVLIVGGYLFVVGVLAQVARRFGGTESFQFQALVVLVGLAGLAVLLLSDRLRQRVHGLVSRHFGKAQHDSVRIWSEASRRLASVEDPARLSAASAKLISETFDVLSVTVWLVDTQSDDLVVGSSTTAQTAVDAASMSVGAGPGVLAGLRSRSTPFDLEAVHEPWADAWRHANQTTFPNGGHRWCVPLRSGDQMLGVLVLADRINGAPYTLEELDLLRCMADQMTSVLLNLRLANEVARGRELEAFRTMSAFFVHDLKNAAASLNLMLKNLPVHFDDPAFRADALRGVGNTAHRIDEMISRLGALRQQPAVNASRADLNQLVSEAVDRLSGMADMELTQDLRATPGILVDREQILSVVTNLLINARDAAGPGGRLHVSTREDNGRAVVAVADNGCGMSEEFLRHSLFRPFHSTKSKGLGIGMFQSRMVVEAHGGTMQVESTVGQGTTVRVSLPARDAA